MELIFLPVAVLVSRVKSANATKPTGFWSAFVQQWSSKLWLPTKNDSVQAPEDHWSASLKKLGQKQFGWSTTRQWNAASPSICDAELECLQPAAPVPDAKSTRKKLLPRRQHATTEEPKTDVPKTQQMEQTDVPKTQQMEQTEEPKNQQMEQTDEPKKEPAGKTKKIRVYPNPEQRETLMGWMATARWTYNQCVDAIQKENVPLTLSALRERCVNKKRFHDTEQAWVLGTPYEVRDAAMTDGLLAYKTNFAKQKRNPEHKFDVRHRTAKDPSQSIAIRAKGYTQKGVFYPQYFGKEPLRANRRDTLPAKLDYDSRLVLERPGHFYLCIPEPLDKLGEELARL